MPESKDQTITTPTGTIGIRGTQDPDLVLKAVRRSLGVKGWRLRKLTELRRAVIDQELMYHPLWLGKILTFADRPPFEPKRIPNAAFVDAVSGYRGVLERIPDVDPETPDVGKQIRAVIDSPQKARPYVQAVLHTVNRGYVLKKPQHQLVSLELLLLPLWKVTVDLDGRRVVYVNAVTGEPESYMAQQWASDAWLSLDPTTLVPLKPTTS